jgi:hypothetical protein
MVYCACRRNWCLQSWRFDRQLVNSVPLVKKVS